MSFVAFTLPIGATIVGGAISSRGADKAADTAAAGSDKELELIRESRDLARADLAPWREAGGRAIAALESMTGIGVPQGGVLQNRGANIWDGQGGAGSGGGDPEIRTIYGSRGSSYRFEESPPVTLTGSEGRAYGGPMGSGTDYNINELGPENLYSGGVMTRGRGPVTIDGRTGYVQPNSRAYGGAIQGRLHGGFTGGEIPGGAYMPPPPPPQIQLDETPPTQPTPDNDYNLLTGTIQPLPTEGAPPVKEDRLNPILVPPTIDGTDPALPPATESPPQVGPDGFDIENPGGQEGGYNFMTDPGYAFRFGEGMRAMDRSAAARGGLLSGGYGRKLTRYGQDFASNEYTNVYNRISNIAGLGQVSAGQSGGYAMNAGAGMGTAAAQSAYAQAGGQRAQGNIWGNVANELGQLDWGSVFGPRTSGG